ncbi:MAG: universal stress protein [Chitinophagaceae bacterium]
MKTIIVPTDFSPAALNATNYAADMALAIKASLHIFHVYQLPLSVSDTPIVLLSVEEMKETAESKLDQLKKDLEHITSGALEIKTEARLGNLADELENCCKAIQPFTIVMGTRGHSAVERALFGSNTLKVIKHLSWPIICVPIGKEYGTGIKKIGLACDFRELKETTPVPVIRTLVEEFHAELHVLNVDHDNQHLKPETPTQMGFLHAAFKELNPQYHYIESRDIEDGLNEFTEKNNLDIVITIPKKHKLLDGLFKKSSTKQLVFESHVPVMCLHE